MFPGDLHRGDVDVIHHLDFSDGLQVLDAMLILHDLCVIDVNMEVVIVWVNFDLMGGKQREKKNATQFLWGPYTCVYTGHGIWWSWRFPSPENARRCQTGSWCISLPAPIGLQGRSYRLCLIQWSGGWNERLFCRPDHRGNWSQTLVSQKDILVMV